MDWFVLQLSPALLLAVTKASVVLSFGLFAGIMLRRASASTRYFVICASIFIATAIPALTLVLPAWELPVPTVIQSRMNHAGATVSPGNTTNVAESPEATQGILHARGVDSDNGAALPKNLILYLWLAGTFVVAARVTVGLVSQSRARMKPAVSTPDRIQHLTGVASQAIGLYREAPVVLSGRAGLPYVVGILRPTLVLPSHAVHWPADRLTAVLMHELAHVKRRDHITWPLANLAVCWLWFNPLVWICLARMKREREKACDDRVLVAGKSRVNYAQHLYDICFSLRAPARFAPTGLMFAHRNEIEERIMHMLSNRNDRRPLTLRRRFVITAMLLLMALPMVGVSGFQTETTLKGVSSAERDAILSTLAEFYVELSNGSDYQMLRERFLTSDYFDRPELTLENLPEAVQRIAFDNTISLIMDSVISPAREVHGRVMSIQREGDEYVVTQHLNVTAQRVKGKVSYDDIDGSVTVRPDRSSGTDKVVEDCLLVNSLVHQIRFRKEDGMWKISRLDDGVALMRMDTNNPYGPIFLFWMEDIDSTTTPFGPGITKIIPLDIVPSATNAKFVLKN